MPSYFNSMNGSHIRDSRMFSRRSRFTVTALKYNFIAFILITLPAFYYYNYYSRPDHLIDETITFNLSCAIALLVLFPGEGVLWLNVLFNLWPEQPDRYRKSKKIRKFSRLLLCLASKGDNIDVSYSFVPPCLFSSRLTLYCGLGCGANGSEHAGMAESA
jgi:hypothetical protein